MTTTATVPKSITRIQEEWNGFPIKYIALVLTTGAVSLILIASALLSEKGRWVILVVLFLTWYIFFKFMRTPKVMERSWLMYQFFIQSLRGQNIIAKFTLPAGFLERIIPLKRFHNEGLIEFGANEFGLLLRIEPNRVSDDEIDTHIQKVRALVDSLHGSLLMKFFVCSIPQSGIRPLEKNVINIINKQERTKEQKEHLYSIYHQAHDNTKTVVQWHFYVFIGLGTYKTLEEAMIARQQYYPGIESRLQKSGVFVMPIKEKNALAMSFRECICQGVF